jgi:hypothetical protein
LASDEHPPRSIEHGSVGAIEPPDREVTRGPRPRTPWIVLGAAAAIAAVAWAYVARSSWITAPHAFAWRSDACEPRDEDSIVLGDRVIASCTRGWAWLDPRRGVAKLAWPIAVENKGLVGIAVNGQMFSVAFRSSDGLYAGVAGRDMWLLAPQRIADTRFQVVAMAWIGEHAELVLTTTNLEPPTIVRLKPDGFFVTPPRAIDVVKGALPTTTGWQLIRGFDPIPELVDERGVSRQAPELAWLKAFSSEGPERAGIGVVQAWSNGDHVKPDGSLVRGREAPFPRFVRTAFRRRFEIVDGALRATFAWGRSYTGSNTYAWYLGKKPIVLSVEDSIVSLGDHPTRVKPIARSRDSFHAAVQLRDGKETYLVADRTYVKIDDELDRVDDLSLVEHLGAPVLWLAWALFGLPIAIAAGLALRLRRVRLDNKLRRDPLQVAAMVYIVTGLAAFVIATRFL